MAHAERSPTPMVVSGVQLPPAEWWTLGAIASRYGEVSVLVRDQFLAHHRLRLREYLEYVQADAEFAVPEGPLYLADWNYERDAPELAEHLSAPVYCSDDWFRDLPFGFRPAYSWAYIGPPRTRTPLHRDPLGTHSFLFQIEGVKRWHLFPPSAWSPEAPPHETAFWPLDAPRSQEPALEAILAPGDLLFVPGGWWHQVENVTATLAATWNFVDHSNCEAVWAALRERKEFWGLAGFLERSIVERAAATCSSKGATTFDVRQRCLGRALELVRRDISDRMVLIDDVSSRLGRAR